MSYLSNRGLIGLILARLPTGTKFSVRDILGQARTMRPKNVMTPREIAGLLKGERDVEFIGNGTWHKEGI